jgi:hypothetical protein
MNYMANRTQRVLDNEDIGRLAPSVFATTAQGDVSDRYRFIPTIQVVDALRDNGYNVVQASQSTAKELDNKMYTRHMLRLRHNDVLRPDNVGDEIPEIVLMNSHNRTSTYKLMLGIFRLVCSNGLVVASETIESLNIRHVGGKDVVEQIIQISRQITQEVPKVFNQIQQFKKIVLSRPEQIALAESVKEIVPSSLELATDSMLFARRYSDNGGNERDLWKTSNVIQENIIKGGVRATNTKGNRTHSRQVKNIKNNIDINKAIWKLTEEMAKIKAGA